MTRNAAPQISLNVDPDEIDVTKNYQVNGTIPGALYKVLDDHRWTVKIDRFPKLVAKALMEYAENHGLLSESAPEAPEAPASK